MANEIQIPLTKTENKQARLMFRKHGEQMWIAVISDEAMQDLQRLGYIPEVINHGK